MTGPMSDTAVQPGRLTDLANPTRYLALSGAILPWLLGLSLIVLAIGLVMAFQAPADYQQGITVRIMYIHVPFAWLAMMTYTVMAVSALGTLVWRHPLADVSLKRRPPSGRRSRRWRSRPVRSGASRCGAPGGCGTRA